MAPSAFSVAMSPAHPFLARDTIAGEVGGVKNTFSSWDNCMAQSYCKWPAIVGIIIGSLILLSILSCVVRCCCCGMECCCAACSCINACCPSPRGGGRDRTQYREAVPPPSQGYRPTPAPYYASPAAPQFATFDTSKKVNGDSLPAMPSWETSTSKKVLDDTPVEEVEMDKMDPHDETKPMLAAHQANSRHPAYQNNSAPYQDQPGSQAYGQNGYRGQTPTAAGAMAVGGMAGRSQAGSAQGYRNAPVQHPGMPSSQNSYASTVPSSQGYAQARPQPQQQAFGVAGYGQQRQPGYEHGSQPTLGHDQRAYQSENTYPTTRQDNYGQSGYDRNQPTAYGGGGYAQSRPAPRQDYDSYNSAPSQGQTFGTIPSPPQPAYGGHTEYQRPAQAVPSSLAHGPGPRGNAYQGQQGYGNQQYQGQY